MTFTLDKFRSLNLTPIAPKPRLLEFKPRKAKFGFKIDSFELEDIIPTAKVLDALSAFPHDSYAVEYGIPFRAKRILFKVYTDDPIIADHVRLNFAT